MYEQENEKDQQQQYTDENKPPACKADITKDEIDHASTANVSFPGTRLAYDQKNY